MSSSFTSICTIQILSSTECIQPDLYFYRSKQSPVLRNSFFVFLFFLKNFKLQLLQIIHILPFILLSASRLLRLFSYQISIPLLNCLRSFGLHNIFVFCIICCRGIFKFQVTAIVGQGGKASNYKLISSGKGGELCVWKFFNGKNSAT